jgi:iron-containing alcohol dehydrogenase-like protein
MHHLVHVFQRTTSVHFCLEQINDKSILFLSSPISSRRGGLRRLRDRGECSTASVPHGYKSYTTLPHVLRFNHPENIEKQARVSEALGHPEEPAADAVAELIAGLGLPTRLRDVGVKPEQLDLIAENSMRDRWVHTNPRKIDGPTVIRTLLDAAW